MADPKKIGLQFAKVMQQASQEADAALAASKALPKVDRLSMSYKDVTKRVPEVADAVERLFKGEITKQQYNDIVNTFKPVTPYSFVPKPATPEEAIGALRGEAAKSKYGKQVEYEPGSKVGLRLDIPAYTDKGVWVNSIHDEKAKKVAYGPVASVKNANLGISQNESKRIALGGSKAPYAKIKGDWNPMSEEEAVAKAQQYLNDPEWRQIGMDPERHSYFYDRHTMQPITGAEEVIQIGPLVLGKNPKYGKIEDFEYADGGKIIRGALNAINKASKISDEMIAGRQLNRTFKTADGYTFREMPSGEITNGDMSWPSAKEFMRDMPHSWREGDELGKRRAMIESYGRPDPENMLQEFSRFMSPNDPQAAFQRALNEQRSKGTLRYTKGEDKNQLQLVPPEKRRGGLIRFGKGGKAGVGLDLANAVARASQEADAMLEAERLAKAAERAAAGRKAADVTKATSPMRMSEALGNMNVEGKGALKITQSDRTRVGGGNIGGAMFPGLQQVDPLYEGAVWGVGKKSTGSQLINQSDPNTLWTTVLGSAEQLKTNPLVFNKLRRGFTDAMKEGRLSDELASKINHNLALKFGEGADIRDPKIWQQADTFEKRALLADLMMGQGVTPKKGGIALGGEKSGKGVIFRPSDILKQETEPLLLHPEHGGTVPTFAVGPRLFTLSGEMKQRPDLHPGYPFILQGEDKGIVFAPAPGEVAMRDYANRLRAAGKKDLGYHEWTKGEKGKGLPSQDITEEYLTYLQKQGYKKGGPVHKIKAFADDESARKWKDEIATEINKANGGAIKKLPWKQTPAMKMAQGGVPSLGPASEHTMPDPGDAGTMRYEPGYANGGAASPEEMLTPPTDSEKGKARLMMEILARMAKEQGREEIASLKKPRAATDILNKGLVAGTVGIPVDLMNMGLEGIDYLRSKATGKPVENRLASDKPFLGSEHLKDLMKQYGMVTDEERPMMETAASILSPGAVIKGAAGAAQAVPKAARAVEGGLNAATAAAARPFVPATVTMEAVAPDLAKFKPRQWQETATRRLTGEGAPVSMETLGGRQTTKRPAQGVYLNDPDAMGIRQLETNPMVAVDVPRAGSLSANKPLRRDVSQAGMELGQESVAAHRFLPMATQNIADASSMLIKPKKGAITSEEVAALGKELPHMIVAHNPRLGGVVIAPFELKPGQVPTEFMDAQEVASRVLGDRAKFTYGKTDPAKDLMYIPRADYVKEGATVPSASSKAMRERLKRAEGRLFRQPAPVAAETP